MATDPGDDFPARTIIDGLTPGKDLDLSGMLINDEALAALRDRTGGNPEHPNGLPLGNVRFDGARFDSAAPMIQLGPLGATSVSLDGATFTRHVELHTNAETVSCVGTRFNEGATLRFRYGRVDATRAVFGAPSSIGSWPVPPDDHLSDWTYIYPPTLTSLRGTDVSNLVLTDVYLAECRFSGAHRLDQLRIEGHSEFGYSPAGWWRTRRRVLAEEAIRRGWRGSTVTTFFWSEIAGLYRSLRKSFEDSKNEAGAGDFYYGETEARRKSSLAPRAERWILTLYWLLSGYGQRAGRALVALVLLMGTVTLLLTTWGQPFGDAALIAVGAVVFRDDGAELTTAGEWTVLVARFLGPVLLALAVLAVRARVKR